MSSANGASNSQFGGYFNSLSSTLNNLGQVANQVTAQIDGSLQHVALNIEQAIKDSLVNPAPAETGSVPTSPSGEIPETTTSNSAGGGLSAGGESRFYQSTIPTSSSDAANNMTCDICGYKFNFLSRRKQCKECDHQFCSTCCPKLPGCPRLCARCRVLVKRPPTRGDLMQLKVKDLQRFLVSRKVNTSACVEKKDLVELVMRQNGAPYSVSASTSRGNNDNSSARSPIERQRSFPTAYVESTHRHDWLAKLDEKKDSDQSLQSPTNDSLVEDFVVVQREVQEESSDTEISTQQNQGSDQASANIVEETPVEIFVEEEEALSRSLPDESREPEQTVGRLQETNSDPSLRTTQQAIPGSASNLEPNIEAKNISSSPRKFADRGLVYLTEISTLEELNELSAKQMKDILAVNRVNFKGVVEKEELLKILQRLWKSEQKVEEEKDKMEDSDLCKICMDNPVDCVMLECGHMCTCIKCGKQMNECPMCRQYVVRVVKIFKS